MYQVIVVGTDGSETAGVAVNQAAALAMLTGSTLHIVHAYQLASSTYAPMAASVAVWADDLPAVNADIVAEAELVCERAGDQVRRAGAKAETHPRAGDAAEVLIEVAKDVGADLIVVGNRGMTGMRRFVLGSVPNKVSHHSPCDLLIVDTTPHDSKAPEG
jgi:nucleotide-binding universal stress UspA family protein